MIPAVLFLRSELLRHRRGWIAVFLLAMVGIAVTVTAGAGARRTLTSFERFRQVAKEPHLLLASEGNAASPVDGEDIRALGGVDVVGEAAALLLAVTDRDLVPGLQMIVIAAEDDGVFEQVYRPRVIQGRLPTPDASDEITINERLASDHGIAVGDAVTVSGPSAEQWERIISTGEPGGDFDGPRVEATVVGITRTTSNLEDMTFQTYEALARPGFFEQVEEDAAFGARLMAVRLSGGDAAVDSFLETVDPLVPDDGPQFEPNYLSGTDGINGAIRVQAIGLALFGLVALATTLVAVGQAISRQRALASRDARVLTVLGLSHGRTLVALTAPALIVIGTAGLIGSAVSIAASPLLPFGVARQAEPDPGVRFDALVHAAGPALLVVLLIVAELVATMRAMRTTGMGADPTRASSAARAPRTGAVATAVRSLPPAEIGIRLALSRGGRRVALRSAVAASTFAVATIAAVAVVATTLTFVSTNARAAGFPWDYKIGLGPNGEQTDEAMKHVDEAAARLTISYEGFSTLDDRPTMVTGLEDIKGTTELVLFDGRAPSSADEILLGRDLADDIGADLGDVVSLGGLDHRVVGIGLVPIINSDQRHTGVVVTGAAYERLEAQESITDGHTLLIAWTDAAAGAAAIDGIENASGGDEVFGEAAFRPTDLANLEQIGRIPDALAAFLALVGLAALAHALVTISRSRSGEFATLRALGFTRGDVRWTVTWQSWTMAAASVLIGVPAGVVVGRMAWQALASSLRTVAPPQFPTAAIAVIAPAAVIAALVIAAPIGRRLAAGGVAHALRTE